ncbi:telomerase reverse transcriptase [Trichoderma cornu-damae]|uniref:Telomerase reverse transcriptase n=1 Tax=Trichoderma cornu-damae TaxID=654480 RepID=A0A9P8QTZ2_9HYPO|nr:telomerase reverse transcriptase [Trichoderma cornu-damae]
MPRGKKRKLGAEGASPNQAIASSKRHTPVKKDLLQRHYPHVRTLREHVLSALPDSLRVRRKKIAVLGSSTDAGEAELQLARILDTALVGTSQAAPKSGREEVTWQQWLSFSQKSDESYAPISSGIASSIATQSEIVDFVVWALFSRERGPWPKHLLCDGFRRTARDDQPARSTITGIFSLYPNSHVKALREAPWPHLLALLGQAGERVMVNLLSECSVFLKVDAGLDNYLQLTGIPLSELETRTLHQTWKLQARMPTEITIVRSRIFYAKPATTAKGLVHAGFKHIRLGFVRQLSRRLDALNRYPYAREPADADPNCQAFMSLQRQNEVHTTKLMMHIFPRQFGLHNVFTSVVNTGQTTQKFHDYTLREDEISKKMRIAKGSTEKTLPKLPKRLRGTTRDLVRRLQVLHARCSYLELLKHYCPTFLDGPNASKKRNGHEGPPAFSVPVPVPVPGQAAQAESQAKRHARRHRADTSMLPECESLVELACPTACVSAFCQAVLSRIIPDAFWGGEESCHNKIVFLRKVDHFIKLRRFEMVSLHEITQDFKVSGSLHKRTLAVVAVHSPYSIQVTEAAWLEPPFCQGQKTGPTDVNKRLELFHEFLYYVFDSLLIPLIRSNFYVTESNTHRFRVFYFRHDVWRLIAEPSISSLKEGMFEEIKLNEATRILDSRRLGFSQLRLLPKGTNLRPITNLGRRQMVDRKRTRVLGPSINSILKPIHAAFKFETLTNPSKLGSTLFSVGGIYERLKSFKDSLAPDGRHPIFYFAKLDVKAAFDTIPQSSLLKLMSSVPSQNRYVISKHAEVKPGERSGLTDGKCTSKPVRRWHSTAVPQGEPTSFLNRLESGMGSKKKNTVFVDSAVFQVHDTRGLLALLSEHVGHNIVKIGKKYYRQKKGIPQGSVLSTIMCNYFYADLEAQHLGFLDGPDCLLLRLVDDFLLITLDKEKAVRFVEIMHQGLPEYGVEVSPDKTLVNFDMQAGGESVRKLARGNKFPYCGTFIDCKTLEITKDRRPSKGVGMILAEFTRPFECAHEPTLTMRVFVFADVSTSITVAFGRSPGQNFQQKVLSQLTDGKLYIDSFKFQSHLMFFDTRHNSVDTVLDSLRSAFSETALKMWAYVRCLSAPTRPAASLIIGTIKRVVVIAFSILTSKWRKMRFEKYACEIRKAQVMANGYSAFLGVLGRRQTGYREVIAWLKEETARLAAAK